MFTRISVTDHAIQRWRERVSTHAREGIHQIKEALNQSRRLRSDEFVPFAVTPGTHYYLHEEKAVWFVVEPIDRGEVIVITIFAKEDQMDVPVAAMPVCRSTVKIPDMEDYEAMTDSNQKLQWLNNAINTANSRLSNLTRTDDRRPCYEAFITKTTELRNVLKVEIAKARTARKNAKSVRKLEAKYGS